ncbi:MAG: hypothetical protein ACQESC_02405 [Nanobdellota archaeon]
MTDLKDTLKKLHSSRQEGSTTVHFSSPEYVGKDFSSVSFSTIPSASPHEKTKIITFIDGGQQVVFSTPSLLIGTVSTASSSWKGMKRVGVRKEEFFVLISRQENSVSFYARDGKKVIPFDDDFFKSDSIGCSFDSDLEKGLGDIRRLLELSYGKQHTATSDVVCIDGSLRCFSKEENDMLNHTLLSCHTRSCSLIGLQKTTSLVSNTVDSLQGLVDRAPRKKSWLSSALGYHTNKLHPATVHLVKLHPQSDHAFVLDVQKEYYGTLEYLLTTLSMTSCDPVFLGYPYGLVEADKLARIEDDRIQESRLHIHRQLQGESNKLLRGVHFKNAHEILDSFSF